MASKHGQALFTFGNCECPCIMALGNFCFNSFKIRYELNQNRKYTMVSLGGYNIDDEDLEIFKLKKLE